MLPACLRMEGLMLSKRSKICGILAFAVAALGLAVYLLDPAVAGPPKPTGNDSNSGLISSRLGM
jgi:hypothetical protein